MTAAVQTPEPPAVPAGRFGCPHCRTRFESVGDKKRHLRDTHPKEQNR